MRKYIQRPMLPLPSIDELYAQLHRRQQTVRTLWAVATTVIASLFWVAVLIAWS